MQQQNEASRQWSQTGTTHPPSGHIRRCGRCEAFANARAVTTMWVWVSEVGDWYEVPATGVQLSPIDVPPHHEDEHFDIKERYGFSERHEPRRAVATYSRTTGDFNTENGGYQSLKLVRTDWT